MPIVSSYGVLGALKPIFVVSTPIQELILRRNFSMEEGAPLLQQAIVLSRLCLCFRCVSAGELRPDGGQRISGGLIVFGAFKKSQARSSDGDRGYDGSERD